MGADETYGGGGLDQRVRSAVRKVLDVKLFEYSLLAMAAFLVSALVFMVFMISPYMAFVPAACATAFAYYREGWGDAPIRAIERGNPALRDRLSAAYDNKDSPNFIVRGLMGEVARDMDEMRTDAFLNTKRVDTYVGISIICVFAILSLLFTGFRGFDLPGAFGSIISPTASRSQASTGGGGGSGGEGEPIETAKSSSGMGASQDIYGDVSMATLQGQDMELELHPEYGEGEDLGVGEEHEELPGEWGDGILEPSAAETYSENIPAELERAVRAYFDRLAEE